MAEVQTISTEIPADLKRTLMFRQFGFLVAVAASVAIAVYVVLWSQTPNYSLLYGSLSDKDIGAVLDALQKNGIEYRIDENSGAVMVPTAKVREAKMKLANDGLPRSANTGFGILQEEQGLGTSQFIEKARYQHALETELARSIEQISSVRAARVHIALGKQSVFVRNSKPVSASVVLDLYSGYRLSGEQVAAISNLVAASVPNLDRSNVSIIDQNGHLMTQEGTDQYAVTASQFDYANKVEQSYIQRIENILVPILGPDSIKAQVTAEFDFTRTEQTRESYNPDLPAIRSEQLEEEMMGPDASLSGVPGALSNTPPAEGQAPEVAGAGEEGAEGEPDNSSMQRRTVRNYELDKTISHTQMPVGKLRRISAAVVIDYKRTIAEDGTLIRTEHSPEEIVNFTNLVKEAIGFNPERGDRVNVMNAEFALPEKPEPLPAMPIWQEPWVWDIAKQSLGALFVLFVVFGILRPAIKNMANKEITLHESALAGAAAALPGGGAIDGSVGEDDNALADDSAQLALEAPTEYDNSIDSVSQFIQDDPKVAASVVKNWIGDE